MYSEEIINQVREANDIVSVIGQVVRLEKKGANYFGLCPFHGEKTASFSVSPRKQICYCFGCQKGGDVIKFIMEYEQLSYPEAIRYLAERAHITLPDTRETGEQKKTRLLRDRLLEINKEAAFFYHDKLMLPEGKNGLDYFINKRMLSRSTITHFGLGYAGKTPGELYRHLKDKGYTDTELKDSGLLTIDEQGAKDKFWNRVMFPIMDINNKVIGFGGRVMGDGLPKYLNSPETPVFDKSGVLYGLNFARRTHEKCILLCEGYMDVISLHQAGFTNACASLGTALTDRHARLLRRYTDTVILTQDSDEAGINAKIRSFPILHDAGLKVKVLEMGSYKDPDEFIKANGPDAYRELILHAKNAFLYIIEALKSQYDLSDPAQTTEYYNEIARKLCMFSEPVERDTYLRSVCTSQMLRYEDLKSLTEKYLNDPLQKRTDSLLIPEKKIYKADIQDVPDRKIGISQNIVLYWMVSDERIRKKVFNYLDPQDFSGKLPCMLANKLKETDGVFNTTEFLESLSEDPEIYTEANRIFIGSSGKSVPSENIVNDAQSVSRCVQDAIRNIRISATDRKMKQPDIDMKTYQNLIKERNAVKRISIELEDELFVEN